ncbi:MULTISPECIES: sensor histidine kinase [Trueperella]|uniref:histidine kinase n=1 Tax=Trueperella bernardiae TaxID=59561 RepID=A0AAW6ZMU2_9ACTO|nr:MULTISPECIES: histidine kinase [Trueperella]MCM3906992.1 histidine kinase [Trueperella bernardiae]MDK8601868.1 histidine kinase [Trueperella bernardiae]MDV6239285.1 histidine kinase [Trueperella bernardiae]OCW60241.1 histidine kinase [Trueperella bernardiae]OFS73346.1 two-component sensor histidine kinase [Trueperella sp. HMSC08B05]
MWRKKDVARQVEELTDSRRQIVSAFEIERRRIERDLHDGAQQHLVASGMAIGEAQFLLDMAGAAGEIPPALADLPGIVARALQTNEEALRALRETVNEIHPKVLSDLGLERAVRGAAERSPVPVRVVVPHALPDMPEGVMAAAYFLATEALTNVAKYAPGARTTLLLAADETLRVSVVDDGPGGASVVAGHGLAGLRERLAAFGGKLEVNSPVGGPTMVVGTIPLLLYRGESAIGGVQ